MGTERESLFASLRPYLRHLPGCQMLASHVTHELVCTCGLDALKLGVDTSAAVVDGADHEIGHHETVGERQGGQPAPNDTWGRIDALLRENGEDAP